jgi:predicted nucleic acid-binding protein
MKDQPPQVADRFAACRVGEVVILAITAAELEFAVVASGAKADRNREALEQFLLEVVLVTNNLADFQAYPDLRRETWVDSSSTTAQQPPEPDVGIEEHSHGRVEKVWASSTASSGSASN